MAACGRSRAARGPSRPRDAAICQATPRGRFPEGEMMADSTSNKSTRPGLRAAPRGRGTDVGKPQPAEGRMDRIARRAHEIYERRGGEHGKAIEDWLQAEREIDAED